MKGKPLKTALTQEVKQPLRLKPEVLNNRRSNIMLNSLKRKMAVALSIFTIGGTIIYPSQVIPHYPTLTASAALNHEGIFRTYNLSETEIRKIASLCQQEQGTAKGAAAEASLMANIYDLRGITNKSLYEYVRTCGWWAKASSYMDKNNAREEVYQAVKIVLTEGKRTIPGYVDEHDCFSDISSCTNNGNSFSKTDRSQYWQFITQICNTMGSTYTFYCYPDSSSDPFGYTKESNRECIGEAYYDYGTWTLHDFPEIIGWRAVATESSDLNIRSGPGVEYDVIGKAPHLSDVAVIEYTSSEWTKIYCPGSGVIGYCNNAYLYEDKGPDEPYIIGWRTVATESSALNIRSGPGVEYDIIGKAPHLSDVGVIEYTNSEWTKIYCPESGVIGYCNNTFLYDDKGPDDDEPDNIVPESKTVKFCSRVATQSSNLNIRIGPSTDYDIAIKAPKDATVEVLDDSSDWWYIRYNGVEGFASSAYLASIETVTPVNDITIIRDMIVNTLESNLNLRSGPSTGYEIIGKLPKGAEVGLIEESNGWAKVKYGDSIGWCSSNYLINKAVPETTAPPPQTTTTTTTKITTTTKTTTSVATKELKATLYGDANCDNEVNMADAVLIMQSVSNPNKYCLSPIGIKNGDLDGNGITNYDALAIQKMLLKL